MQQENNIKAEMARYGLTTQEMAKAIGVSMATFSLKVNGKRVWNVIEANRMVKFFAGLGSDVTLDSLFGAITHQRKAG